MDLTLTEEQRLLRDGLARFLAHRYELGKSRAAARGGAGWQPEIWHAFAHELGILGATLPERVGGSGGGPTELMVIAEELGRALVVEPYVDTVVLAGGLLARSGGVRADEVLARVVTGDGVVGFAALEPSAGHALHRVATTARRDGDGWVLDGTKTVVTAAPLATHLVVSARTLGEADDRDGISLFLLACDPAAPPPGLRLRPGRTIDDRQAADLEFTGLRLPADALLGAEGAAWPLIERAVDEATAAICAEAVGCMRTVLADTVAHTTQRQQFGRPISTFQVLRHRMVDMHLELEQAAAAVHLAISSLDADPGRRAKAVSAAKVTIARAARFVGQSAVQLHGGMGLTEELAVGHYFKRLTAIEHEFGPAATHLARYAARTRSPAARGG